MDRTGEIAHFRAITQHQDVWTVGPSTSTTRLEVWPAYATSVKEYHGSFPRDFLEDPTCGHRESHSAQARERSSFHRAQPSPVPINSLSERLHFLQVREARFDTQDPVSTKKLTLFPSTNPGRYSPFPTITVSSVAPPYWGPCFYCDSGDCPFPEPPSV